ncbi:hypothetical protein EJV47_14930 [Hymenobacter gummosus]|uniref:Uncharacterized protein n=1 Tax=Hymenobacter gummosus TaxID=1776032 RepID=A0A3S0H5M0_9BACT|nr:hypothetical protein [Hymenobacter gummosus]RTQ48888.1 hypothetical protein EJV47_14930 [Hymenobacter gummosus]
MSKKLGIEPREVDLSVGPAEPLTPQAAQEIARFMAASKQKQKRRALEAASTQQPVPATTK